MPRTGNEDVDDTTSARFPARQTCRVKNTDEGADEVIGIGICTEMAPVDRALDQSEECAVDEATCALYQPRRSAGNGVHGRKNELLAGHVIDE